MSVRIVPASPDLVSTILGDQPAPAIRAIAGYEGERLLGLGGYYRHGPRIVVFANLMPYARRVPLALYRAARQLVAEARELAAGGPVITVADPAIPAVPNWLRHLGFEPGREHPLIYHLRSAPWNTSQQPRS